MKIEIEKNIAMPANNRRDIYPFRSMEVGDSFKVPEGKRGYITVRAPKIGKMIGAKFSVLKTDDGYRCWRTA